jgi:myo-inositol-1(or 4)-monophosphatase
MRPELNLAMDAAREAGAHLMRFYGSQYSVENKNSTGGAPGLRDLDYDPLTSADIAANTCLQDMLRGSYPDYGWLSEETVDSPERLTTDAVWIVDPLDGTKEFVSQIGEFAVSIALVEAGRPAVAAMYNPVTEELFSAVRGGGSFLNGKRIYCTECPRLYQAALTVSRSEAARGEVDPLRPHVGNVREIGSVAYKLAVVSAGFSDVNVSVQPKNEWDVCAGDLLVCEAGGLMLDLDGNERQYNQRDPLIRRGLVAGNPELTNDLLTLIADLY